MRFCPTKKDIKPPLTLKVEQVVKAADVLTTDDDLWDRSCTGCRPGIRSLNGRVVFQPPLFVDNALGVKKLLGPDASSATAPGPNDHLRFRVDHGPRSPREGFKIGGHGGILSVGFIGKKRA